mmetsp:Transcript_25314/g.53340  ORF Transcript_25314/g.53340 Transcript_25314/m.53340 type:complete len:136 (-) Transcript_25314:7-414(-)
MASVRSINPSCARSVRSAEVGGWILMIDCTGHGCSHSSNPIQSIAMRCANFGENVARRLWTPHGTECEKQHNTTQHNERTVKLLNIVWYPSLTHPECYFFVNPTNTSPLRNTPHRNTPHLTSPQHTATHRRCNSY